MTYICPGIGLIALIIALLWWWLRMSNCRHDISLRNVAAATNAHAVRVSAYTPGAQIRNASVPSGWTQTTNYPTSVLWKPTGGGVIPSGNPLPGTFSIWVQNNAQPDKRVIIEWLSKDGKEVICKQLLRVGCGEDPALVPENEGPIDTEAAAQCRCLSAETDDDEESNEIAEPDLSVDVGTPVQTGFLQVEVPYAIDVEPPTLQFTRQWDVTVIDEMGDEQPITVPISDNLIGQATFTLPDAGEYNFYLTVTDPATCVSATDRDEDDYSDSDVANFVMKIAATSHFLVDDYDPCDPRKYRFTNDSTPGDNPVWTVYDLSVSGNPQIHTESGNDVFDYTFPNLNVSYKVCLKTDGASDYCETIKPTVDINKPKISHEPYNSCVTENFVVQFVNETKATCPIISWDWDFGDNTPHSSTMHPQHTYAVAGTYTVILKMTVLIAGVPTVFTSDPYKITVGHWMPDIHVTDCGDGTVVYETTAPSGWSWKTFRRERTWSFPTAGTHWHEHLHRHKKKVRVCYDTPGLKIAKLYAINHSGGACENRKEVNITSIDRCCPHDKLRFDDGFTYNNKQYLLRTTFRYHGGPQAVIFGKAKLMLKKNNIWRRKRARNKIEVEITGSVYTKVGDCRCADEHAIYGLKAHSNRAKVAKRVLTPMILDPIRVKKDSINCKSTVKIDANHTELSFDHSLWQRDCGCPS